MDALTIVALLALLAGILVALTQRVWPIALLCGGLFMSVLADAGLIVT
ncbi:hypothetical protein AB0C33_06735 [Nonomuraea sp. NPDC048881]